VRTAGWVGVGFFCLAAVSGCRPAHGTSQVAESRPLVSPAERLFDLKAAKEGVFVVVGDQGKILRTEDGGTHWLQVQSPTRMGLLRVCFVDGEYGWAVGHEGVILHTQDGGKSWQGQDSGTKVALFAVDFVDRLHGFAVGDTSTFLRSQDGGQTWEVKQVPLSLAGIREDMTLAIADTIYYGMDFIDARNGWIVGEYGNIRHTLDGGETWASAHASLLTGANRDAMDLPAFFDVRIDRDSGKGVAVGAQGKIAISADKGETWRFSEDQRKNANGLYDAIISTGGFLTVGGGASIALGQGDAWQSATVPAGIYAWLAGVDVAANGEGFAVGSHGILLHTRDFGKTWMLASWEKGSVR
jgi:photosystem II stability/assembly factor-like uncharacterized protein